MWLTVNHGKINRKGTHGLPIARVFAEIAVVLYISILLFVPVSHSEFFRLFCGCLNYLYKHQFTIILSPMPHTQLSSILSLHHSFSYSDPQGFFPLPSAIFHATSKFYLPKTFYLFQQRTTSGAFYSLTGSWNFFHEENFVKSKININPKVQYLEIQQMTLVCLVVILYICLTTSPIHIIIWYSLSLPITICFKNGTFTLCFSKELHAGTWSIRFFFFFF